MSDAFDPYRTWLGISPHERPASHYRLLGISLFEHDPAVIAGATDRQMAYIRSFASGPRAGYTQGLLNELAAAKLCLLDPRQKAAYDASLRSHLAAFMGPQPMAAQPAMAPPAGPPPALSAMPPAPSTPPAVSRPASSTNTPEGSSGTWMLAAAGLLLLFLVGGFAVVLIALANRRPTPTVQPTTPGVQPMPTLTPPVAEVAPEPLVVHQEGDGSVNLAPSAATFFGPGAKLVEENGAAHLDGFTSPEDRAEWLVQLTRPGFFRIEITYAADSAATGGEWRLASDDREKRTSIRDTGGRTMFLTENGGFVALSRSGRVTISFGVVRGAAGAFVVEKIRLVPRGQ